MRRGQAPTIHLDRIPGTKAEQRRRARTTSYPIAIEKDGRHWRVTVFNVEVGRVATKETAKTVAHMIGRYRLQLGDLAFAYVRGW